MSAATMSLTFAANVGPGEVQVRSGPLTILAGSFAQGSGSNPPRPAPWGFEIPFTTPYTYTGGNLVYTIQPSRRQAGPRRFFVDGETPTPSGHCRGAIIVGVAGGGGGGAAAAAVGGRMKIIVPCPSLSRCLCCRAGDRSAELPLNGSGSGPTRPARPWSCGC